MSKAMTVKQLKEFLETYTPDDETEIVIGMKDNHARSIKFVSIEKVEHLTDKTQSWVVMFR
jgi:hypothetical protein